MSLGTRWCLALLLSTPACTACFGQTVEIRLVNVSNESPVKKKSLLIYGISGNTRFPQQESSKYFYNPPKPDFRLVTDAKGEAEFELPKPLPPYFYVHAELSGPRWDCDCLVRVSTEELMQKGLRVTNADHLEAGFPKSPARPKPGEILFLLKPTPWWELWWRTLLWPVVKQ